MNRNSTRLFVVPALSGIAFILMGALFTGSAQTPPPQGSQAAPPQTQTFTADQLTDLVAPIALYPDGLLSQVLVASTYPLEVVEAQQWLQGNPTAFPDVLKRLNQDIRWTRDVGNAFLAQEADVMAAVQRLRASARANGRLTSTPQETVSTETQGGQPAIVIQPANPDVVYVPAYDPAYVWGPPVGGSYPSLYYPTYGFGWGPGIDLGFWGGWDGWGWGPNWFGGTIFVDNDFFHRHGFHGDRDRDGDRGRGGDRDRGINRERWAHNPGHRLGVPYPNQQLSGRFQGASAASRANQGGFGMRGPLGQPNSGRPGMPINPQGVRGMPPQGGASRMIPNLGMPMRPVAPNPGAGVPRGVPPQGIAPQGGASRMMPVSPGMVPMRPVAPNPGAGVPRGMPLQGIAPQGGASRMMPASPGMVPMRPAAPGFGGGIPRGFAPGGGFRGNPGFGGHGFGGNPGFGGHGFGGGFGGGHGFGGGFGGGHGFGGGGGHGGHR